MKRLRLLAIRARCAHGRLIIVHVVKMLIVHSVPRSNFDPYDRQSFRRPNVPYVNDRYLKLIN